MTSMTPRQVIRAQRKTIRALLDENDRLQLQRDALAERTGTAEPVRAAPGDIALPAPHQQAWDKLERWVITERNAASGTRKLWWEKVRASMESLLAGEFRTAVVRPVPGSQYPVVSQEELSLAKNRMAFHRVPAAGSGERLYSRLHDLWIDGKTGSACRPWAELSADEHALWDRIVPGLVDLSKPSGMLMPLPDPPEGTQSVNRFWRAFALAILGSAILVMVLSACGGKHAAAAASASGNARAYATSSAGQADKKAAQSILNQCVSADNPSSPHAAKAFASCVGIPKAKRPAFEKALAQAALNGHLGSKTGRDTFYGTTVPRLVQEFR